MTNTAPSPASNPVQSAISRALTAWFLRPGKIADVSTPCPRFRLVEVEGPALAEVSWTPGHIVQFGVGGLKGRTYTPIEWDIRGGRMRFLGFLHGSGPGSQWLDDIRPGESYELFGPRKSMTIPRFGGATIVVGDETSFGLGAALAFGYPNERTETVFEVADTAEAATVLAALGLDEASPHRRNEAETHLPAMLEEIAALASVQDGPILLTGKAQSIQYLSRGLKRAGLGARLRAKAYWAPGKTGLD